MTNARYVVVVEGQRLPDGYDEEYTGTVEPTYGYPELLTRVPYANTGQR